MPQPPAYQRAYDFTQDSGDQTNHSALNTEFDALQATVEAIRANLALIQNDQGGATAQFVQSIRALIPADAGSLGVSELGAPLGAASLDANGRVIQRLAYAGQPNGVPTLDGNGAVVQEPASKGKPNGIPSLDAAGNVIERLAYEGAPSGVATLDADALPVEGIGHVANIAALRALTSLTPGKRVYVKAHTNEGDGGHGVFRYVSGAAPSTYTDDNGTVIVPTGGDGSSAWVREYYGYVHPEWFGAKGDGVTDDSAAINAALSVGDTVLDNKTYYCASNIIVPPNTSLVGGTIKFAATGLGVFPLQLGAGAKLLNVTVFGSSGSPTVVNIQGANVVIHRCRITNDTNSTTGAAPTLININQPGLDNIYILDNLLEYGGYQILVNSFATCNNLHIRGNRFVQGAADAIEINLATTNGVVIEDNIIDNSHPTATDINSGFAIGIARSSNITVVNNHIIGNRREAVHVEDGSTNIIICNNRVSLSNDYQAVRVLNGATQTHVRLIGNIFEAPPNSTKEGIWCIYDAHGTAKVELINNIVSGFNTGYSLGIFTGIFENNKAVNCNTAVSVFLARAELGRIVCEGCQTLINATIPNAHIKDVFTDATITSLGSAGVQIERLHCYSEASHPGGAANMLILPAPSRISGRTSGGAVLLTNGNIYSIFSSYTTCDGTNVINSNSVRVSSGSASGAAFAIANGQMGVGLYSVNPGTYRINLHVEGVIV